MKKITLTLICVLLLLGLPQGAFADHEALRQLRKDTDFIIYVPQQSKMDWKLEIPVPYPYKPGEKKITYTRFSYFDMSGAIYLLGVEQHKAYDYKATHSITSIDLQNNTSLTKQEERTFTFNSRGELVTWGDIEARFEPWMNKEQNGGFLKWIQGNTYIEMSSVVLTREQMIEVAQSMKPFES
ncbi:hypothetical protein [Paenibacillus solani]|uniref:DUF4367 domain-containing protein n=1 Tax=Paenibacillus solani TaxID=1705565 RepID=A0A0M1P0I8_9BACL|nr:hypothetical protein [Paenibacillus solani]KOR88018.1 hypothetical protein AM231_01925 [Paenibacillus solani]